MSNFKTKVLRQQKKNAQFLSKPEKSRSLITKSRALSIIPLPTSAEKLHHLSVQAVVFLTLRPMTPEYGTLLTALSNGRVLVWSNHNLGGYIDQFNAIHMAGDSVSTMITDSTEKYLFTGTMLGYVKTWLLTNYCLPEDEHVHISMPQLRLNFPFLMETVFLGRAKRSVRHQKFPVLLNSFKAHKKGITSISYITKSNILITGSGDHSVRMWTLGGRYIGTFGSPVRWREVVPNEPIESDYSFTMPPDIKRETSFTTLHVLTDGETHPVFRKPIETEEDDTEKLAAEQKFQCIYGKPLKEPILGHNFTLPERPVVKLSAPALDLSAPYVSIQTRFLSKYFTVNHKLSFKFSYLRFQFGHILKLLVLRENVIEKKIHMKRKQNQN